MKILRKADYEKLEGALNLLYAASVDIGMMDKSSQPVQEALGDLGSAMQLIFEVVDPMR